MLAFKLVAGVLLSTIVIFNILLLDRRVNEDR